MKYKWILVTAAIMLRIRLPAESCHRSLVKSKQMRKQKQKHTHKGLRIVVAGSFFRALYDHFLMCGVLQHPGVSVDRTGSRLGALRLLPHGVLPAD